MAVKILIAYATASGSTQEIASFIAEALQGQGIQVEVRAMRDVDSLEGYRALVLGMPLYMFHWHADARRFIKKHRRALSGSLPLALFSGGLFVMGDQKSSLDENEVRTQVEHELARYPWLNPASMQIVGGRFDPQKLGLPYKLIPGMRHMPPSDLRDWDAIRTWAASLPSRLNIVD